MCCREKKRKRSRRKDEVLEIVFKNSETCYWGEDEYTDYKYDGKCIIIIKDKDWVALYNMDCVLSFVKKGDGENGEKYS